MLFLPWSAVKYTRVFCARLVSMSVPGLTHVRTRFRIVSIELEPNHSGLLQGGFFRLWATD